MGITFLLTLLIQSSSSLDLHYLVLDLDYMQLQRQIHQYRMLLLTKSVMMPLSW